MNDRFRSAFSKLASLFRIFTELSRPYKLMLAVIVVGSIFLILPQSLFHPFRCESTNTRLNHQAPNGFFINDQVIVVGTETDVAAAIAPLSNGLTLVEGCDLSYLNTRQAPNSDVPREQRKRVMRLYEIRQDGLTVEGVVNQINEAQGDISADPNYLVSLLNSTSGACSLPNPGGGSGGGKDYGDPAILDPNEYPPEDVFMNQWAFGSQGINLPSSSTFTGREVRVGVFDTSPFQGPRLLFRSIGNALPSPLWLTTKNTIDINITSNHGLFVAGLIHGIAPKSRIQLIRVLNDDGCGELWQINKAIQDYTSRMSAWTGNLDENVFNFSWGVNRLPQTENLSEDQDEPEDQNPENDTDNRPVVDWSKLSENIFSLEQTINEADMLGAIIVAAAGNDSEDPAEPAKDMVFPAKYENVIGVAATNTKREMSCYSNLGDVSAPGGEGGQDPLNSTNSCAPRADTWDRPLGPYSDPVACQDPAQCAYGLISLGETDDGSQYMYWSGTSFAAPLVSGLAALAFEEGEKNQVLCLIRRGTLPLNGATPSDPNWGVIDITDSLSNATLSACGVSP